MGLIRFLIGLFWFLAALLGLRILSRWLGRHLQPRPGGGPRPESPAGAPELRGAMVRDPVCGTWVDPRIAVSLTRGGETIHFCSDDCRKVFTAQLHPK
jgi:YHS domain-containing protein